MVKKYYTSRTKGHKINVYQLYYKLQHVYLFFKEKDYFEQLGEISCDNPSYDKIKHEAYIKLSFQPFPITKWEREDITEDRIFDVIEFLYDYISKPGPKVEYHDPGGYPYFNYGSYDREEGRKEYIEYINMVLNDYGSGYELSTDGEILTLGEDSLKFLFEADILPYDEENVDSKIRSAIRNWRSRNQSLDDRKETIRILADVFEWLKKSKRLEKILDNKDDSALYEIINKFEIRHHNPDQKSNYDKKIWYSWMFHFYLATYHAVIRLIIKSEGENKKDSESTRHNQE